MSERLSIHFLFLAATAGFFSAGYFLADFPEDVIFALLRRDYDGDRRGELSTPNSLKSDLRPPRLKGLDLAR